MLNVKVALAANRRPNVYGRTSYVRGAPTCSRGRDAVVMGRPGLFTSGWPQSVAPFPRVTRRLRKRYAAPGPVKRSSAVATTEFRRRHGGSIQAPATARFSGRPHPSRGRRSHTFQSHIRRRGRGALSVSTRRSSTALGDQLGTTRPARDRMTAAFPHILHRAERV
jgi:hypothetical protein